MGLPRITAEGGLTADPEIRFTPSGKQVVNFTIACKDRIPDGSGGYKDTEATFLRCQVWGKPGEHLVESARKGDLVMVSGRYQQRSYETPEGDKRTAYEVVCETVGVALTFTIARTERAGSDPVGAVRSTADVGDEPPF